MNPFKSPKEKLDIPGSSTAESVAPPVDETTLYAPEKKKEHIVLTEDQKDAIRHITLGIEEVDDAVRSMAIEDVVRTMENGNPLNRIITDEGGGVTGYIACEDFIPREAYIKYFGTTGETGRSLLREIPAFIEYAKQQGYIKLNFHGWNARLNHVLERYGFSRLRTDSMGDLKADFYEKTLALQKPQAQTDDERQRAFEAKYIQRITQEYQQTLGSFAPDVRGDKERIITSSYGVLSGRLALKAKAEEALEDGLKFAERQQIILKLKLARHFQRADTLDANVLYDAITESPKFINTDKGSLHRLLEVHEEKTLQKIAEIRKRQAEITGEKKINPYEALFTTASGDYYVARLMNMPHLEQESAYMNHCVGTSDSYISKMKRGDVEILSFRRTPKINPQTQKLEGDVPVMTIEYNLRTKVIEQMKKRDDEYLEPSDPYFKDVIDALKQLRLTPTDTGKLRDFKKISESELGKIVVKNYHVLTEQGEISFRDFNPDSGLFILKTGVMNITLEMPKGDAVKILRIIDGITCKPDEIARTKGEITEGTKVYIGNLFDNFFNPLPKSLEHIYTSFPEGKIERSRVMGGTLSEVELRGKINEAVREKTIQATEWALGMMQGKDIDGKDFATLKQPESINLVRLSVGGLGLPDGGTIQEICDKAEDKGLELCPAETGPQYRLQYTDQPMGEYFNIGMKPITGFDGHPCVFNLNRGERGLWLNDFYANPTLRWSADDSFVFRLRKYVQPLDTL